MRCEERRTQMRVESRRPLARILLEPRSRRFAMSNAVAIKNIVVGVDFSDTSILALDRALSLAWTNEEADVHALAVLANAAKGIVTEPDDALRQATFKDETATTLRETIAARIREMTLSRGEPRFRRVVAHVSVGMPAEEIAQ